MGQSAPVFQNWDDSRRSPVTTAHIAFKAASANPSPVCRMMGVVSQGPVYYDLFEEFADLATKGMCPLGVPDERGHKDGWGLVCFRDGQLTVQMKDAGCATDASKYYGTAWKIAKLNIERAPGHTLIALGHLRRASEANTVAQKFAHPFVEERDGRSWAFQHNGSLVNATGIRDKIDSQVLFGLILDNLRSGTHADVADAIRAAREVAIAKHGGFTSLNLMLSDGSDLHVYRDFQSSGQYYTLFLDSFGEMVVAASEPILAMKAEPIPKSILHTIHADLRTERTAIA
jgi:predicted glutamine amidotransferase